MAERGKWNAARLSPMILTAAFAILICALLVGLTSISTGAAILVAVVILLIGLAGVVVLDMRGSRKTA